MSVEFGFFESVDDDRLYYSDSFNKYFKGMYEGYAPNSKYQNNVGSGVFRNVGDGLMVIPGSNPNEVVVTSGKAIVDYRWFEMIDEVQTLSLSGNPMPYPRYDCIVLRCNSTNSLYQNLSRSPTSTPARSINIAVVEGKAGNYAWSNIPIPPLDQYESGGIDDGIYEMPLALILRKPGTSSLITTSDINNTIAPVIRGVLNSNAEVQTYAETYNAKMEAAYEEMQSWIAKTQNLYDLWFYDISNNLTVSGLIRSYHKHLNSVTSSSISLDMTGYEYDSDDVFIVTYNGLMLAKGTHYSISVGGDVPTLELIKDQVNPGSVNEMDILIIKTNIDQRKEGTLGSSTGDNFIYVSNITPTRAYGFKIHNIPESSSQEPVIAYSNRNLAMVDGFESDPKDDRTEISFINNEDGSFSILGQNLTGEDIVYTTTVSTRAFAKANIYCISCPGSGDGGTLDGEDSVIFSIENSDGTFVKQSTDDDPSFEITDDTFGDTVVFKITIVAGAGVDESLGINGMNYTIQPQVEVGDIVHDFVRHIGGEFTYGASLPTFTDTIDFIWPKEDPNISKLQLLYYVLAEGSADEIEY